MSTLRTSWSPPPEWPALARLPCQADGFGKAMTTMGYWPLYLWGADRAALALVRGTAPGLMRLTARANVFVADADPGFVEEILRALAAVGIAYVKVGDTTWGVSWERAPSSWRFSRTRVVRRHTFVLDLTRSEAALVEGMDGAERKIRKAEREGVRVRPVQTAEELTAFCSLSRETSRRVRARTAYTAFPDAFFEALYRALSPSGVARFYVGWGGDQPLAACLFLCTADTMLYYLGGSTRDRALTAMQAPAAVFWHAIREAKRLGMSRFDFGGCTPTDDPEDPRYGVYAFKKRWGGAAEVFYNLEVVLAPLPFYLQERVLSPLWDRLHPLYFALRRRSAVR